MARPPLILDGETLQCGGESELVRMPVALISHSYLSRVFGRHTSLETAAAIQPSVVAPGIPASELHLYSCDLLRRQAIARGRAPRSSSWAQERYRTWAEQFGPLFFDEHENIRRAHPRALFTPTSAKILSYYFASQR